MQILLLFFFSGNGDSSPYDGETNVAASTSSISVKFSDADGDALSLNSLGVNIMDLKRSSDNFKVSSNPSFNSSNNTLTLDVSLACEQTYYFQLGSNKIIDGNGGGVAAADATSNPKIVFTTEACPNTSPVLLSGNGDFPYDGETNVAASTSSISVKFSDADGDVLSLNSVGANVMDLKRSTDNVKVSSNPSFNSSNNTLTLDVSLACDQSYYLQLGSDRIIDGNGGGVAADATSNPKIVFTTEACPNNNPSLLVDSGNTSPVNGATNIDLQQLLSTHSSLTLTETI